MEDYLDINRKLWNDKVAVHLQSDFYNLQGFMEGATSLREVELSLLGEIQGKEILHLQCHFGQDSLSLARMGAHVTGVDLSDEAIKAAQTLKDQLSLPAQFIQCDILGLPAVHSKQYDWVFSTYGTIGWLPDMSKWAEVVHHFLKPGGKLLLVEFHPVVWMFDDKFTHVQYSYFNDEPISELTEGTYAENAAAIANPAISWNHPLAEVMGALLQQGLSIVDFQEYPFSPYPCFSELEEIGPSRYRIKHMEDKLPMLYSLVVEKVG
ncbi:MAG: class I SAM-dependent methyltransferase [Bacteroidota bacterium]